MKNKRHRFLNRTNWIILVFMTVIMGFPFLFYHAFSTTGSDILKYEREKAGIFGVELSRSLETGPLKAEAISKKLDGSPLIAGVKIEIFNSEGILIAERSSGRLPSGALDIAVYKAAKKILDTIRGESAKKNLKASDTIRKNLIEKAYKGLRGVDYLFESGRLGDRLLYFSYPLNEYYSQGTPQVKGVLLMEYKDTSTNIILQKQRNQFAIMCLIFIILLVCYVSYILIALVLPLKKLLRKSLAVIQRTEYLLPENPEITADNEIGEITRKLDRIGEMLTEKERETGQQMSELKHIIRNPLAVIRVSLEGLMINKDSEQDRTFSRIIQKNLSRIDDYLSSYSRIPEIPKPELKAQTISIPQFIRETVSNYTPLAKSHKIRFEIENSSGDIFWKGFPNQLSFVVEQIIDNAIDYSPENGLIKIESLENGNSITIKISDQGPGIPGGREDVIFKQYVSFRKEKNSRHTGTGLFLTQKTLKRIGGNISASNSDSGGAVFTIMLPLDP